jgi:hypothetical protein
MEIFSFSGPAPYCQGRLSSVVFKKRSLECGSAAAALTCYEKAKRNLSDLRPDEKAQAFACTFQEEWPLSNYPPKFQQ